MTFALYLPQMSFSGRGALIKLVETLKEKRYKKPLLITESALVELSLTETLIAQLRDHHIEPTIFDGVIANPTDKIVEQALQSYRIHQCDAIIGFGGGSAMDTAKALRALVASPSQHIYDLAGVNKIGRPGPLLCCVSTTSGSAAEMTSHAVITDSRRHVKMVMIDPAITPDIAVNDPTLVLSLPKEVTAASGMGALAHAIEAYVSNRAHPLTDHAALAAITTITRALPQAVTNGHHLIAREQMAHGQFLAGMAFNSAGLGLVHSMAHQPSATHNLSHSVCSAILLPIVCEFSRKEQPERFAQIAKAMGVETEHMTLDEASKAAIQAIEELAHTIEIPKGLSALGIYKHDIERWILPALADPYKDDAPRPANTDEIRELYRLAL